MQNLEFNETANSGFELKGQFNMGCQWRVICAWVWIKHDCVKSEFELKGQFNIGCQWQGVVSWRTVQIIRGVRISEGQIIRAILYVTRKIRFIMHAISFCCKDKKRQWQEISKSTNK